MVSFASAHNYCPQTQCQYADHDAVPGRSPRGRSTHGRPGPGSVLRQTGQNAGASPVDRVGWKHHMITDGSGTPLAVLLTGDNRNNVTRLIPLPTGPRPGRSSSPKAAG